MYNFVHNNSMYKIKEPVFEKHTSLGLRKQYSILTSIVFFNGHCHKDKYYLETNFT